MLGISGALWFLSWAEGEYNVVCCSLELLIYSVGDLTISILSSKCGGRKAPFGLYIILSIILHQFSYACTAFESKALRLPSENTYFYVFVCLFVCFLLLSETLVSPGLDAWCF